MRIAIVALENSLMSAIIGLADLFWMTNQALSSPPEGTAKVPKHAIQDGLETIIVSADGRPQRDPQGRFIPVESSFHDLAQCDVALVTGMALGPDKLPPISPSVTQAANWLRAQHKLGVLIGAACAGTFVVGEAGLLNMRRCTTTWWLHHAFKQRFPSANPVWGSAIEEQDGIITTGGPLSWIDLALAVIRHTKGPELAKLAADVSVTDSVPLPQLLYAPRGFINVADPMLLHAEQIVRHAKPGFTTEELAKALNFSERTLHRRLKNLTNESPKEFVTRVRIETACIFLEVPGASVKQVANKCGYTDDSAFRRAFIQFIGMTPKEYKGRISLRNSKIE